MISQGNPPPNNFDALLKRIAAGVERVQKESAPDTKDIEEVAALVLEKERAAIQNEWLLIELRERYGRNIIRFLWVYFFFTAACIIVTSYGVYRVSETVLAALVGGTAVTVLGVVGTVAAGLFRPPRPPQS